MLYIALLYNTVRESCGLSLCPVDPRYLFNVRCNDFLQTLHATFSKILAPKNIRAWYQRYPLDPLDNDPGYKPREQ